MGEPHAGATTIFWDELDPGGYQCNREGDRPFFAYSTNYLVDLDNAIIVDVEATVPIRQAEVGAVRDMLTRTRERFDLHPDTLTADTAYGTAEMLGWLVDDQDIEPHIPVFDKSERKDGAYPATDFIYDETADEYRGPGDHGLKPYWRDISKGRPEFGKDGFKKYFARKQDCAACALKSRCTPNQATRKISRSRHEHARQKAREIATTDAYVASGYARKKVESRVFQHNRLPAGIQLAQVPARSCGAPQHQNHRWRSALGRVRLMAVRARGRTLCSAARRLRAQSGLSRFSPLSATRGIHR
ncbi:transposase [Paracoccus alkanivorans]|uniref:transposase n=1 Tax=Paracoccus alkanivorans TaxID=2116655 RepID=UPI00140E1516|nr:transposase [Paracoccus alkanivorans]